MKYTVQVDTKGATKNVNALGASFGSLKKIGAAAAIAAIAKAIFETGKLAIDTAKKFESYENQLRLITDGSDDLAKTMGILAQAAVKNRASFADTVELYSKLTLATAELGVSSEDVLTVTSKLSQALAVAGADAATTSSVVRQFGQAMASGTVRGDEFNSLVEGLGPALSIMAKETGLNVGTLRKMSREGELTAEVMFDMLKNSNSLTAAFANQVITLEQLETAFKDSFDRAIQKLGEASGAADLYRDALIGATRASDKFTGVAGLTNMSLEEMDKAFETGSESAGNLATELGKDMDDIMAKLQMLDTFETGKAIGHNAASLRYEGTREELEKLIKMGPEAESMGQRISSAVAGLFNIPGVHEQQVANLNLVASMLPMIDKYEKLAKVEKAQNEQTKALQKEIDATKKATDAYIATINGLAEAKENAKAVESDEKSGKFLTDIESAQKAYDEAATRVNLFTEAIAKLNSGMSGLSESDTADALDDFNEDLIILVGAAGRAKTTLDELTKTPYDEWLEGIVETSKAAVAETQFMVDALTDLKTQLDAGIITQEVYDLTIEALKNMKDSFGLLGETIGEIKSLEAYEAAQKALQQALNDEKITMTEYLMLLDKLKDKYGELDPFAQAFAESLSQAGNALTDDLMEGRDALESFKDFFEKIVKDMIAQAIKLFIIRSILSSIAGAFDYDLKFGDGINIDSISKREKGGPVKAGQPYLVGEGGMEIFTPSTNGNITPNNQIGGGGATTNNYITNNINAMDSRSVAQVFAENRQVLLGTVEYARKETSYGV